MAAEVERAPGPSVEPVDLASAVRTAGVAVLLALLGGLLVAAAPLLGVARAAEGSPPGPEPVAAVLAGVLALAGPLVAGVLLRGGRPVATAGVLTGWAATSVPLAVLDVQLFVRVLDANRLELVRPEVVAELAPGPGAVAVVGGHLLAVGAAAWCALGVRRAGVLEVEDVLVDHPVDDGPLLGRVSPGVVALVVVAAVALAAAVLAAPFTSTDPVVLVPPVVQGPVAVAVGAVLLAVLVLVSAALALVSTSVSAGCGLLAGAALGALAVVGPRLAVGALGPDLGVGTGAVLGVPAALVLLAGAVGLVVSERRRAGGAAPAPGAREPRLPGAAALHLATACAGLLCGVLAVLAGLLPLLDTGTATQPDVAQARVLLLAGVLLAAACAGMFGGFAAHLRPVVGVVWTGVVLGGGAVLQAVLVATGLPQVGWGPGAVLALLAVLAAGVCAALAGLAGAAERDDVDTSEPIEPSGALRTTGSVLGALVVAGFALPLYTAPGFSSAALLDGAWGWESWAVAVTVVAVCGAVAVALSSRPARGAAVLVGVALVLGVQLASWPLTVGRVQQASPGPAVALLGLALLAVAATVWQLRRPRDPAAGRRSR